MPDVPDIVERLKQARTNYEIISLQADLVRMHSARQWSAVIAIGEQLADLDPSLADPDGLVTAARDELAEAALAHHYRAGLLQLDRGDLVAAAATFAAIEAKHPGYRDTAALLSRARRDQPEQTATDQQPSPGLTLPASPLQPETTPDQATASKAPRPPSSRQRWLGRSALLTGGLASAAAIPDSDPAIAGLISAVPFLVGWWLLRSRPRIGAWVIGISAVVWTVIALLAFSEGFVTPLLIVSCLLAVATVVLSLRLIRSP